MGSKYDPRISLTALANDIANRNPALAPFLDFYLPSRCFQFKNDPVNHLCVRRAPERSRSQGNLVFYIIQGPVSIKSSRLQLTINR